MAPAGRRCVHRRSTDLTARRKVRGRTAGKQSVSRNAWRTGIGHGEVVTGSRPKSPLAEVILEGRSAVLGLPEAVHACLFDLDGVLTDTASVHTKAWKVMFDAFLQQRCRTDRREVRPVRPGRRLSEIRRRQEARRRCPVVSGQPRHRTARRRPRRLGRQRHRLRPGHSQKRRLPGDAAQRRRQGIRRLAPLPGKGGRRGSGHRGGVLQRQHPRGAWRSPGWRSSSSSASTA